MGIWIEWMNGVEGERVDFGDRRNVKKGTKGSRGLNMIRLVSGTANIAQSDYVRCWHLR